MEDEGAVREGAALRVLAGEADREGLRKQAAERERLGVAPIDGGRIEAGDPTFELLGELRMDREAFGHAQELLVQLSEACLGDRGDHARAARRREPLLGLVRV